MEIQHDELTALLHLQHIDLEIAKRKKELEALPQRNIILSARQKKEALREKRTKVEALKADVMKKITRIENEEASLAKKEHGLQAAIEATSDFRNIEARTKELNGIAKRRTVLAEDTEKVMAELAKLEDLEAQIARAFDEIVAHENTAIASFQEQGGALKVAIMRLEKEREVIAAELSAPISAAYAKAAARGNGVAVGRLDGSRCGVCRTGIEGGRLIELKAQAPLGSCPHCKRLLIVE